MEEFFGDLSDEEVRSEHSETKDVNETQNEEAHEDDMRQEKSESDAERSVSPAQNPKDTTDYVQDGNDGTQEAADNATQEPLRFKIHHIPPFPPSSKLSLLAIPSFISEDPRPWSESLVDRDDNPADPRVKIRWTFGEDYDENGERIKISNTRIVEWKDGTSHLVIGDEYFPLKSINLQQSQNQILVKNERNIYQCQGLLQNKYTISSQSNKRKYKPFEDRTKSSKQIGAQLLYGVDETDSSPMTPSAKPAKKSKGPVLTEEELVGHSYRSSRREENVMDISQLKRDNMRHEKSFIRRNESDESDESGVLSSNESDESDHEMERRLNSAKR